MPRKVLIGFLSMLLLAAFVSGVILFNYFSNLAKQPSKEEFQKLRSPEKPQMPTRPEQLRTPHEPEYIKGEIIVKYKSEKVARVEKIPVEANVVMAAAAAEKRSDIEYAEPNYVVYAFLSPNDPYYKFQWNFYNENYKGINAPDAWDGVSGDGVIVAVVDTGIAYENYGKQFIQAPDLAKTKFTPGYDFVNNDFHANDDSGHGTHIAGIIAQSTNNKQGTAGIAYSATLMPVKVLDAEGSGNHANIAKGIRYAADKGAKIINLSFGGPAESNVVEDAVRYAHSKGAVIIAAAGNNEEEMVSYPAAYDEFVIAVSAIRCDGNLASYSCWGDSIDIAAPGGDKSVDQNKDGYSDGILQQTFEGSTTEFSYFFFEGTSMAAAHVSGVAALVESAGVTDPDGVKDVLQETAVDKGDPGQDEKYGHGVVDAGAAVDAALSR